MAKEPARRRDDDEPDYEVVEEKPRRKLRDDEDDERPRSRRRDEDEDDDERPRPRGRDEEDEERPRNRKRAGDDEGDDDRPRRGRRDEDDEEERPRKKKKKKPLPESFDRFEDPRERAGSKFDMGDWIMSGLFFTTGLVMSLLAVAFTRGETSVLGALVSMFLGLLVLIPVVVGTMMGVGIVLSIDYGEYKEAIVKLAALVMFNNGLLWVFGWIGIPWFIAVPIGGLVCFGLLMTLFELDTWETNVTAGAIVILLFLARLLFISIILVKARHDASKGYDRDDSDDRHRQVQPREDFDDGDDGLDDEDDEMPLPKKGRGRGNRPPFDNRDNVVPPPEL